MHSLDVKTVDFYNKYFKSHKYDELINHSVKSYLDNI